MTKAELMKMLEYVDDYAELRFIGERQDRDGWLEEYPLRVVRVEEKT